MKETEELQSPKAWLTEAKGTELGIDFHDMECYARYYHEERLKSFLTSEQEIELIQRLKEYISNNEAYIVQDRLMREASKEQAYSKASIHQAAKRKIADKMDSLQLIKDALTLLIKAVKQ